MKCKLCLIFLITFANSDAANCKTIQEQF